VKGGVQALKEGKGPYAVSWWWEQPLEEGEGMKKLLEREKRKTGGGKGGRDRATCRKDVEAQRAGGGQVVYGLKKIGRRKPT